MIVIVCATMSTVPERMSGIRCASEIALNTTWFGLPKMALATARIMSMSKPSICPLSGLRKPK